MLNTDSIHMNVDDDNITTTATLTSLLNTKALLQANDNYHLHSNQHLWITYGWLGICITTILVIILIICSTIIHYTYRRKWRTLDILLAAILIQELPNAIILLSISSIKSTIIHLPRSWSYTSMYQHDDHSNWNFYDILLWLSTSNRFFQFAIITSLIVDRAFILKWPYQYRFSVRHSQIRFYMITLALISAVFGTFAVISHQNHQFDRSQSMSATITTTTTSSSFDFDRSWPTIETTEIKTTNIIDDNNSTTAENGTISTIAIKPTTTTLLNRTSYYNSMIQFSYNPLIYDIYYSYFFIAIYGLLTLICFVAFLYVELNRPKNHNNNNDPMTKNSSSTTTATKNLQSISTLFATTSSSTSTSSSLSTSSPLPSRFSSFANLTNNNAGQQSNNNVSAAAVNHQSSINTGKTTLLPSFYYPNVKHHDQQQQQQMKQMGNSLKINDSDDLFDNSNRSFHHHRQQQQQQQYNNGDSSMISLINSTNNNDNGDGHDPTSVHLNGNSGSTVLSATSPTTNGTTSTYTSMTTTTDNSIHRLIDNNIPHQHQQQQQQQQKCAINTLCNNSNLIGFDNNGGSVGVSSMILSPLDVSINATAADSYSFLKQSFNNHGLSYQKSGSQLKLNILNDSFVDHHHHQHHHHHNRHQQQQQRINNSAFDLRWSSVIGPVLFCFAFNHGPFLVFNLLAIFIPGIWTPFHDLILVALSLFEALLLPLIIFISNETFRDAFTRSCCHCGSHHSHRSHRHHHHHHSIHDKISSICSSNKSSLTFTVTSTTTTTNDNNTVERNVMQSQMLPPPSYPLLTSSSASKTSSNSSTSTSSSSTSTDNKHQTPINTFLTSYHSDLDLLKKCSKIDQSSNKLNDCSGGKISFQKHLQHNNNNYNNNNGDMNRKLHQATSMLDLSLSSRNAYHNYYLHHHNHPNNSQQQQQRNSHYQQQQSQNHHHASRSRYSLALTSQQQQQSQTNNYDSLLLTPKPSFNHRRQQQRPPSVASCHYLFSNQSANQQQQQQSKCGRYYGQFMFGSSILMPKSESTLSVPLNVSSSESFNRFGSSTPTTTSVIPNNYQHHHHNQQMISSNKKEFVPGGSNKLFNHGKCSPISINLNKFDSSTNVTINNMPISNDEMSTDIGYNNNDFYHEKDSNAAAIKSGRSATKLFDNIINGITGRSRSVRKSDSDASTFYNRHNLKRSQIAQNQLSNILYNNFYNKKLASSAFGSEIILLSDNEQQQQKHRNSPLFGRRMANDHKNQNRFDHIDIHHNRLKSSNKQQPQQSGQFPRPHVYLPSVSSLQETNTRSNSCQQLSILNGDADHYHNHLLLKQNLSSLIDESAPLISCEYEQQQQQQSNDKKHHIRNSDDFNKNNSITDARDGSGEPIYASLPNEEEQVKHDDDMNGDDEIKASGSFSARSTLPDNCQLISVYAHASNNDDELVHQRQRQTSNILHNVNENLNLKCFRDNDNNEFDNDNDVDNGNISSNSSNSSSSTVGESSEDIYEEVGHLARSNIRPNNDDLNDFELNHDNNNKRQRSASQDTLIEQNNDPFNLEQQQQQQQQSNLNSNHNNDNDNNNDDDDEDMSDGDDQTLPTADDLDEDQISILSGTSSSTFSSFTTCANQDFEFIVSQQLTDMTTKQQTISSSKSQNHKSNVESVIKSNATNNQMADLRNLKSDLENFLIEKPSLEPSTLSMAAMYYNRLILNSDSDNAKSGHRQRTKLNRRQSFSTAHELRQRILYNQLNNNNENQMGLIEEENDDHNNHHDNGSINEYSMFTTNFSEIFPFKLDRRISSSEDNLLSIISTIANCGDDNNAEFESPDSNFIQTNVLKENLTNKNDENVKIIDHSNGTFIMKRDLNLKNKSAIPRATAHSNASNETLKITIKELKSKKQAQKRTSKSNLNSNQKSKSSLLASNNGNRVYELGSLWERQSSSKFNKESTNSSILKSSSNIPSSSSSSSVTKQNFSQNKFKSTKTSTTTSPSPSSSPSSSSSSSRVSTFITVSPLRTPKHQTNFTSKLLPPSDYVVKQPKQDARQNAILAKNALLMSGIKTPIIKLPLQSQPPMDLHP